MSRRHRLVAFPPRQAAVATCAGPARRPNVLLVAMMVGLVALTGCGGNQAGSTASSAPEEGVVQVVGTDDLRFEPASLRVPVGTELELVCEPAVNHNLVIVETGQEVAVCAPGETGRGTLDLEPGTYTYLCTVPGHSATMRGELTVTE
jgi:plastocyanin